MAKYCSKNDHNPFAKHSVRNSIWSNDSLTDKEIEENKKYDKFEKQQKRIRDLKEDAQSSRKKADALQNDIDFLYENNRKQTDAVYDKINNIHNQLDNANVQLNKANRQLFYQKQINRQLEKTIKKNKKEKTALLQMQFDAYSPEEKERVLAERAERKKRKAIKKVEKAEKKRKKKLAEQGRRQFAVMKEIGREEEEYRQWKIAEAEEKRREEEEKKRIIRNEKQREYQKKKREKDKLKRREEEILEQREEERKRREEEILRREKELKYKREDKTPERKKINKLPLTATMIWLISSAAPIFLFYQILL